MRNTAELCVSGDTFRPPRQCEARHSKPGAKQEPKSSTLEKGTTGTKPAYETNLRDELESGSPVLSLFSKKCLPEDPRVSIPAHTSVTTPATKNRKISGDS